MEMMRCPNCGKLTGFKRVYGFGTVVMVFITAFLWIFAMPLYPKRCMVCGLSEKDTEQGQRDTKVFYWLIGFGAILIVALFAMNASGR